MASDTTGRPGASSSTSRTRPLRDLLVAAQGGGRGGAVDGDGLWPQQLAGGVDPGAVETEVVDREPKRCVEAERDRVAVAQAVATRGLERVGERVAEVEDRALALLGGIAQADGGLEGRGAPHRLGLGGLPERLAGEKPGLHELGEPGAALLGGERGQKRRVDDGARGPVEGADAVLPGRRVETRLAADRRVHLTDERRRHGYPGHAAQVGRGDEPGDVRERCRRRARPRSRRGRA